MKKRERIVAVSVVFEVPVQLDALSTVDADKQMAIADLSSLFQLALDPAGFGGFRGRLHNWAHRILDSAADFEAFDVRDVPIQRTQK